MLIVCNELGCLGVALIASGFNEKCHCVCYWVRACVCVYFCVLVCTGVSVCDVCVHECLWLLVWTIMSTTAIVASYLSVYVGLSDLQ